MTMSHMNDADTVNAKVAGYGISYAITSLLSALLVVLKESNDSVRELLVALTGHHWISHGLLDVIVFVALGAILSRRHLNLSGNALITSVVGSTILSALIVVGFFVL
jgi:hypothetical protein